MLLSRPKTLIKPRDPKYPRKSVQGLTKLDKFSIIKCPLTTESAMKKIEETKKRAAEVTKLKINNE